jgi:hypothetical protein
MGRNLKVLLIEVFIAGMIFGIAMGVTIFSVANKDRIADEYKKIERLKALYDAKEW